MGRRGVNSVLHGSTFPCSVRDWITCMQVCCHSRTTEAYSPCATETTPLHIPYPVYVHQAMDPVRSHYIPYLSHCMPQER